MLQFLFAVLADGTGSVSTPSAIIAIGQNEAAARIEACALLREGETLGVACPDERTALLGDEFLAGRKAWRTNLHKSLLGT